MTGTKRITGSYSLKGLANNQLSPILQSHGWINLEPAKRTKTGFIYSLDLDGGVSITVDLHRLRSGIAFSSDQKLKKEQLRGLNAILSRMLSLDFPLDEFRKMCKARNETVLLALARKGWGRMFRSATAWEDAAKTLCTTNASWRHTQGMCSRLCAELGEQTPSGLRTFPSPTAVVNAGETYLKAKIKMGYRNHALIKLAERAASGSVSWLLDNSVKPDEYDALKEIRSWFGFGQYATNHMMMLLGFHKYLPIDREVAGYMGIRGGSKTGIFNTTKYNKWGDFQFTAYKLERVAKRLNWIGD